MASYCKHVPTCKKCPGCRAENARRARQYRRKTAERAYGLEFPNDLVSIEPIRTAFQNSGLTQNAFARVAGVSQRQLWNILNVRENVHRRTRDAILTNANKPHDETDINAAGTLVPRKDHMWKVHSIRAQGWRVEDLRRICKEQGFDAGWLSRIYSTSPYLTFQAAQEIAWLAEKIGDRKGPSSRTAHRAWARGHYPLIHYDDDGKLLRRSIPKGSYK